MKNLNELTIVEASKGLLAKNFTAVELTKACLKQIKEKNGEFNAFITVCENSALEEAKRADEIIQSNKATPLTGIPFSVKDAICTKGIKSTAGAKILDNYIPPHDATVIAKIRAQGGILIGKTNCDAFGHGASNENSMYGAVRNPYDTAKVSGGSSGGSAVSVASNMCLFSIAEDTGGSIRQPSSLCGVVGFRPSYGRNSRYGIMPMASSLDVVGPMTKTVADCALIMEAIAGIDELDATTLPNEVPNYNKEISENKKFTIGVPKEYFEVEGIDSETKKIIEKKINNLKTAGHKIVSVSLPYTKYAIPVYYIIVPCEDSSNMGRIDAIRYGKRAEAKNLYELYANSRAEGLPEEVKRRIMIGTYALSEGYYDAYYRKAQKVRSLIIQDFEKVFKKVDLLITPTSPFPAFNIGEKKDDVLAMYLADVFVSPSAVAGIPAISVPAGLTKSGLPVGAQIIGPRLHESEVMNLANQI